MEKILYCQSCETQQDFESDNPGDGCPNCGVGTLEVMVLFTLEAFQELVERDPGETQTLLREWSNDNL